MYCTNCKLKAEDNQQFCASCGTRLTMRENAYLPIIFKVGKELFTIAFFCFLAWGVYTIFFTDFSFFEENVDVVELKQNIEYVEYDDLLRYPEENKDKAMQWEGRVVQVMENGIRLNVRNELLASDIIYISLKSDQAKSTSVLEDDYIKVIGLTAGNFTYKAVLGHSITIPKLNTYEVIILKER
jgi:hypothetical protein